MRGDAVDDGRVLAVLRRHLDTQLDVGAVVLVGEDFADVVQQGAPLGEVDVELQLGGHHPGQVGDFLGVLEDVLPVRGAVFHAAHELDQLGVHAADAGVVHGLLPGLEDAGIDIGLGLLDDLLDPAGMDAAVGDQSLQRQAADLAAHRLEARDDHGVERSDITTFAADDAPLHLVRRQHDGRYARLGRLFRGDPLDRERDDFLRFAVGVLLGLFGDVAHQGGRVIPGCAFDAGDQLGFGLLGRQARHLLEPRADVLLALPEGPGAILKLLIVLAQLLIALVDAGQFLIEAFMEVFADRHELFFGRQHEALALIHRAPLDAPSPHVERQCRDEHAAERGGNDTPQLRHLIYLHLTPKRG